MAHRWNIYRSGGVDQVAIKSGDDLANLHTLDPKLWIALSMPTKGVDLDARTLELLDSDKDGYVRQPEILEAVAWLKEQHVDLGSVLAGGESVKLDKLKPGAVRDGAVQLLANLGRKADAGPLAVASPVLVGEADPARARIVPLVDRHRLRGREIMHIARRRLGRPGTI